MQHASYATGVLVIPRAFPLQRLEGAAQHLFHLYSVITWFMEAHGKERKSP